MRLPARWKHWIIFTLVATTASVAAYHLGTIAAFGLRQQEQRKQLATVRGLYIDPSSLDLGEVWEAPEHTFRLTIRNVGSTPRTISRFQTTCGCLQLDPPRQTIAAGGEAEFVAHLDLMHRLAYQWGVAQWPKEVRIDPVFEGDLAPTPGWELKGMVRARVSIDAPKVTFEDRCAHEGPRVWRKVRAKSHVPLKEVRASANPPSAEIRVESSADVPGEHFIFVSPNPSLPLGQFRFEVRLQAVTPDDVVHPCATFEVVGEMQPLPRVTPRMILLGEYPVPSDAKTDVTLRLPAKGWKIDHIETDSTDTLVSQSKDDLEEGVRLHVTQRIRLSGDQVSHVRIVVRKPDKQVETVSAEVRYHGVAARADKPR